MQYINTYKKKYFHYLLPLFVLLFALSALLSPLLIDQKTKDWPDKLNSEIESGKNAVLSALKHKISNLLQKTITIKSAVNQADNNSQLFDIILNSDFNSTFIEIYNSNWELIAWNKYPVFSKEQNLNAEINFSEVFPLRNNAVTYLSVKEIIRKPGETFFLIVSLPIQKHYKLSFGQEGTSGFADSLSEKLQTNVEIVFGKKTAVSKDGRKYSFELKNNADQKIGASSFFKPSLNNYIKSQKNNINLLQSLLLLCISFTLLALLYPVYKKINKRLLKFFLFSFSVLWIRVLLFLLEIPSAYLFNVLTDSSNFSSRFAFGIVRSPLELFISSLSLIAIVFYGLKLSLEHFRLSLNKQITVKWKFSVMICLTIPLILLLWRAFGSIIRSVIFDSTIRYFKEFTLFPSAAVTLMCVDILLAGAIILISSLILLLLVVSHKPTFLNRKKHLILFFLLIVFQIAGWIYDAFQYAPQGTPLIRFIFFLSLFSIFYLVAYYKINQIIKVIMLFIASSIISVALLTYYNSELEKESLRTTAFDLTRLNQEQVKFMVYQSLIQLQDDNEVLDAFNFNKEFVATSFNIWINSLFFKEGINTLIEFYDSNKNYLGGFSSLFQTQFNNHFAHPPPFDNEVKVFNSNTTYDNSTYIIGTAPLNYNDRLIGYTLIKVKYDNEKINIYDQPRFISSSRAGISSGLDWGEIKIYEFINDELISYYGGESISLNDQKKIINASKNGANEIWTELSINNENHLLFLIKIGKGNRTLAIAREEKNYSWNLSDFFKIFFVHSLLILFASIIFGLVKLREIKKIIDSFRTKLVFAFLLISLIPLLLIAGYIRNLTETKNIDMLKSRLNEKAGHIVDYLSKYTFNSSVPLELLCEKASSELQIKFSLYENCDLLYSSYKNYTDAGLFSSYLDPDAYNNIFNKQSGKFDKIINAEGFSFNTVYHKSVISNESYVIEVNDIFNRIDLPLSDVELDIFLFGVFSFAVVLIVIVSTLLSGQISLPIKKLTHATRAVANGDLSIEVSVKEKGEIKELADGFNMMVKKINQSQADIAQFEREEAWKEMAKQVAHEIKNPLTPMKLSVQQLMAAFNDKSPKFNDIFLKVTATVISQIEILKNIASEFSNFARMPRINVQRINIVESISETLNLYNDDNRKIVFENEFSEIFVKADSDQLKRTIVNLIRNSLQADAGLITVSITKDSNKCFLKISDNGKGIPMDNFKKIFEQSFTTKQGGMGIGLYMAKKFIESIDGSISVELSIPGKTVFLITLPVSMQ